MPSREVNHALQMYWNPSGIVYVVHGMESSDQFCQGIKNIMNLCLSENVHVHIQQQPLGPTQLTSPRTGDLPLLSDSPKPQNQANLCYYHLPYNYGHRLEFAGCSV
jgi:hypothetical protein